MVAASARELQDPKRVWRAYVRGSRAFEQVTLDALDAYREMLQSMGEDVLNISWEEAELALADAWSRHATGVITRAGKEAISRLGLTEDAFHIQNPYTQEWLEENGAELVTRVSRDTREGIRNAVSEAIANEEAPRRLKDTIRDMVGLRPDQERALMRYAEGFPDEAEGTEAFHRAIQAEADRKWNYRAMTIARTETMRAANAGIAQSWEVARADGLLPDGLMARVWIAGTGDDRICTACEDLAGQVVGMDTPWVTLDGDEIDGPPVHPNCRCTMGLVFNPQGMDDEEVEKSMLWTPARGRVLVRGTHPVMGNVTYWRMPRHVREQRREHALRRAG